MWRGKPAWKRAFVRGSEVGRGGFEPPTLCLKGTCSAVELTARRRDCITRAERRAGVDNPRDIFYIVNQMTKRAKDRLLSRMEESLLLVVWDLREGAYGVPIRRRLAEVTGRQPSVGAVYVPLERL